jgi:SOS-response transcriptional repressor LexA
MNVSKLSLKPLDIDADFCIETKNSNKLLGIEYGDVVYVKKDFCLENGTNVVAVIDGEFHIKTWYLYDKKGLLAGDGEKPVILKGDEAKIIGRAEMIQGSFAVSLEKIKEYFV